MSNIDIVALIESNPLTKLSSSYNNKLLIKIKDVFTDSQQQIFITSFYCWLNYHPLNDFAIDLDNIWDWLGFSQKDASKRLLEKHFILDKDYKCFHKKEEQKGRGGSNKETILLNIKTFKLFCLKAGTKKANEIHEYFLKLEEMLQDVIQEESNELKLQLEQIKTSQETDRKKFVLLEREKLLLREFTKNCSLVYIIKVKTFENGQYIVKIGESRNGIQGRYTEHKTNYKDIVLLDCFKIANSHKFEKFLHHHPMIKPNRVNDWEGHEKEVELFLIGKDLSYDMLLKVIHDNINSFKNESEIIVEKLMDNISSIPEPEVESTYTILQKILENQIEMSKQIQALEKTNKELLEKVTRSQTKVNFNKPLTTHKLQKINPETMTIVKVYDTVAQCLMEYNYRVKRPSIEKAMNENRIYHGFLWAYVDQSQDPNVIHNKITITPSRPQNIGYIAKLNKDKTEIINVYLDRKTAAKLNGYASHSALDNPVKHHLIANNHYYVLYDKCEPHLIQSFVEQKGEPLLYKMGVGYLDENRNLEQEFSCKYECIKQLKISDKTLAKALDNDILYNNHYFQSLGEKLFV